VVPGSADRLEAFRGLAGGEEGEIIGIDTGTNLLRHFAKTGGERPPEAEKLNPPKQKRRK